MRMRLRSLAHHSAPAVWPGSRRATTVLVPAWGWGLCIKGAVLSGFAEEVPGETGLAQDGR